MIRTNKELERALTRAQLEIAQLKKPPTMEIVHHDEHDPHPFTTQLTFEWRGYQHRSMVSDQAWRDIKYKEHLLRYGVEACVRAHAEAELTSLVTTEETFKEHYLRVRS